MVLVAIFFVSGADAASIVMGTLSQRGSTSPARWIVIFWGAMTGGVAAIMLVIGGDEALNGIQNVTFLGALPFTIVLILLCVSLAKDVRDDPMMRRQRKGAEVLEDAVMSGSERHDGEFELVTRPSREEPHGHRRHVFKRRDGRA